MTNPAVPNAGVTVVRKTLEGKEFSNVYHWQFPSASNALTKVDYLMTTLAPKLAAFERAIYFDEVFFTDIYCGDAQEQPPNASGAGASFYDRYVINAAGTRANDVVGSSSMLPLNTAVHVRLLTTRQRPGMKYYRAITQDEGVKPGGKNGVQWESTAVQTGLQTAINAALTSSGIGNHLEGGSLANECCMCIPLWDAAEPDNLRDLVRVTLVRAMQVANPTARKFKRSWYNRTGASET